MVILVIFRFNKLRKRTDRPFVHTSTFYVLRYSSSGYFVLYRFRGEQGAKVPVRAELHHHVTCTSKYVLCTKKKKEYIHLHNTTSSTIEKSVTIGQEVALENGATRVSTTSRTTSNIADTFRPWRNLQNPIGK